MEAINVDEVWAQDIFRHNEETFLVSGMIINDDSLFKRKNNQPTGDVKSLSLS